MPFRFYVSREIDGDGFETAQKSAMWAAIQFARQTQMEHEAGNGPGVPDICYVNEVENDDNVMQFALRQDGSGRWRAELTGV